MMEVGNTVRLNGEFRNENNVLYDPSSPKVKVFKGTVESLDVVPTKASIGIYYHEYTLEKGDTSFQFSGISGGLPRKKTAPIKLSNR